MNTVGEYLTHASTQLNDQRYNRAFTRWGRGLLLDYMNLGLAEIASYRPEDFTKQISVELEEGRDQYVQGVNKIISLDRNSDGSSIILMDVELSDSFALYDICPPDVPFVNGAPVYKVISYCIREGNPRAFTVEPPVPPGVTASVTVSVDGAAPSFKLTDWDSPHNIAPKYINCLMDFILAKAHELNRDSLVSQKLSDDYFRKFYSVMGVNYKQEAKYRSGYYMGQRGNGDPRAP